MKKSSCNEDDNRIDEMTKKLDLVLKNIKKKSNQLN